MLAMTVFSLMMLVATAGFIGMNRVFIRSSIARELSESSQAVAEDITKSIRQNHEEHRVCSEGSLSDQYEGSLIVGSTAYAWGKDSGLWKGPANCGSFTTEIVSTRYKVRALDVSPLGDEGAIYRVRGVLTTLQDSAINFPASTSNWFDDPNVHCKGSAEGLGVQSCAVEKFNFVVSGRG